MINIGSFVRISKLTNKDKLIHLDLICDSEFPGLYKFFETSEDLIAYINNNTDIALLKAIRKIDNTHFVLNCETKEGGLYNSGEKWEKVQGKMILRFLPIIKRFINNIDNNIPVQIKSTTR